MKARLVVMVPTVVEAEYRGDPADMAEWAQYYTTKMFHTAVPTGHDHRKGPTGDLYTAKLMECVEVEDPLEEMVAPGGMAA
jgi:hypothetical protein